MIGQIINQYRILEKLGEGGMGKVFLAEDTRLKRQVALKFLPSEAAISDESRQRFMNEARAAAALDHPNIGVVHEVAETEDGQLFIAMGYYGSETLKDRIIGGGIDTDAAAEIALQITRGLEEAHKIGLIHRDIKPANIMMAGGDIAKIVDFGLARMEDVTLTRTGTTLGTVAYSSPEQISGASTDNRTDLWSLGVVLYELLTGERPFPGESEVSVINAIINKEPAQIAELQQRLPAPLSSLLIQLLEKNPNSRIDSAEAVYRILGEYLGKITDPVTLKYAIRNGIARFGVLKSTLLAASIVGIAVIGSLLIQNRSNRIRWAREVILPSAIEAVEDDSYARAMFLANEALRWLPGDDTLIGLLESISLNAHFTSEPQGADIQIKGYADLEDDWQHLGVTPIDSVLIPLGAIRLRCELDGYVPIEVFELLDFPEHLFSQIARDRPAIFHFQFEPLSADTTLVTIPESTLSSWYSLGPESVRSFESPAYNLGRYEVTNKEYQQFVDAGAYSNPTYWEGIQFIDDSEELSWDEAMDRFVDDESGWPGPSTWRNSTYPTGRELHPVCGISWYEAVAYARFVGKELPTLYHWSGSVDPRVGMTTDWARYLRAISGRWQGYTLHYCTSLSVNDATSTMPVGASGSLGPNGVYDLIGNVREWIWNATRNGQNCLLGLGYSDPIYRRGAPAEVSPWNRSALNGMRLADYPDYPAELLGNMKAPISFTVFDRSQFTIPPVSDTEFRVVADEFRAFPSEFDLNPELVYIDSTSSPYWYKEKMEVSNSYGKRMAVYLFIPNHVPPPLQTIIYHPSGSAFRYMDSDEDLLLGTPGWLMQNGRALVYPVFLGSYERFDEAADLNWPDRIRRYYQDIVATLNYLEERADLFDLERIGIMGYSDGAVQGPKYLSLESRLNLGVFLGGGINWYGDGNRVIMLQTYLPRISQPVLMVNGRYDSLNPHETSQIPMLEFLGSERKRLHLMDTEHGVTERRYEVIQVVSTWLDSLWGEVRKR
ncbi:protein kinase [Candidatus Zixiibacteriota bacterium]